MGCQPNFATRGSAQLLLPTEDREYRGRRPILGFAPFASLAASVLGPSAAPPPVKEKRCGSCSLLYPSPVKPRFGLSILLMATAGRAPSSLGSSSTVRGRSGAPWSPALGACLPPPHDQNQNPCLQSGRYKATVQLQPACARPAVDAHSRRKGASSVVHGVPTTFCSARNKRIAGIKGLDLYALALFVDPGSVRSALRAKFGSADAAALARDQRLFDGAPPLPIG